jgi:hypothetical protein
MILLTIVLFFIMPKTARQEKTKQKRRANDTCRQRHDFSIQERRIRKIAIEKNTPFVKGDYITKIISKAREMGLGCESRRGSIADMLRAGV